MILSMATLKTDSPLSRRIARSVLQFLDSVEPSGGVDAEALDVAKDCLSEVFKIDQSSLDDHTNTDSLVKIFSSREGTDNGADNVGVPDQPTASLGNSAEEVLGAPQQPLDVDMAREVHSPGRDELFGCFFDALEKVHYFRRLPDGNDDQSQLDIATNFFHNAVKEMEVSGSQTFDQKTLAETFKSQGNKAMLSKVYPEAIDLYTFAIALYENNAVYYCNRAAAYTQVQRYGEAVQDCLKSIELNPNYSKAYSRLGFAYYAQGNYRDAIDKGFLRALQLDPANESVKENIRVAEQKLKEQQRTGSGQSSTSSSNQNGGGSRNNSTAPPPFTSMPFSFSGLTTDISSMLRSMTGNAFPGQQSQNGPDGARETGPQSEPGVGFSSNININELPEEISGAFMSVMGGMFPGATFDLNQQDDSNGRPSGS